MSPALSDRSRPVVRRLAAKPNCRRRLCGQAVRQRRSRTKGKTSPDRPRRLDPPARFSKAEVPADSECLTESCRGRCAAGMVGNSSLDWRFRPSSHARSEKTLWCRCCNRLFKNGLGVLQELLGNRGRVAIIRPRLSSKARRCDSSSDFRDHRATRQRCNTKRLASPCSDPVVGRSP